MEKIRINYKQTELTKANKRIITSILRDCFKSYELFIKGSQDTWIKSDDPKFDEQIKYDDDPVKVFLSGEDSLSFTLKISKSTNTIAYIKLFEINEIIGIRTLYDSNVSYESIMKDFINRMDLRPAKEEEEDEAFASIYDLNNKLLRIIKNTSSSITNDKKVKKVFVSFRFDDHSKSIAFDLNHFLSLNNIEMVSGNGTEPRSVSEKVIERMSSNIDLYILLISSSGSSDWINQEIGFAKAKGLPILVIKDKAISDYKSGMLSDTEYLEFEKNISEAYIGILESIKYINEK